MFDDLFNLLAGLPKSNNLVKRAENLRAEYDNWRYETNKRPTPMCTRLKITSEARGKIEDFLCWLCGDPDDEEVESNYNFNRGGKGLIFCHRETPFEYKRTELEIGHFAMDIGDVMTYLAKLVPAGCYVGASQRIPEILDEYFGIDRNQLEEERLQIIDDQRKLNEFHDRIKELIGQIRRSTQ